MVVTATRGHQNSPLRSTNKIGSNICSYCSEKSRCAALSVAPCGSVWHLCCAQGGSSHAITLQVQLWGFDNASLQLDLGSDVAFIAVRTARKHSGCDPSKEMVWWRTCYRNMAFIYEHTQYCKSAARAPTPGEIAAFFAKRAFRAARALPCRCDRAGCECFPY